MENLDHLFVNGFSEPRRYKSSSGGPRPESPLRHRGSHGAKLLADLAKLKVNANDLAARRAALGLTGDSGITVAIEFAHGLDFDVKSIEWKRDRIEVLSVVDSGGAQVVALYVPDGSLSAFEKRITEYLDASLDKVDDDGKKKPRHAKLVNAIESLGQAAFQQLWTDSEAAPTPETQAWFQVWLRHFDDSAKEVARQFRAKAEALKITVESGHLTFPGRVVVAAFCTRKDLELAIDLLDMVAEVRPVRPNADFFVSELSPREQAEWIRDFKSRLSVAAPEAGPYVTLLDTGVNRAHTLLSDALHDADMHAVDSTWGAADHDGHGSEMAGVLCFGNMVAACYSTDQVEVPHRLESVKILPPKGANEPHLYGWVYGQAVSMVEQAKAQRLRVFATMTTAIGATAGMPSEWSAALDQMAYGLHAAQPYTSGSELPDVATSSLSPRLFVLSAGNVPWSKWDNYPASNKLATIEDPGQAWNALTVGACTDLGDIDATKWPSHKPIAPPGTLAPMSTTSALWRPSWPIKPDVVAEGGNGSVDASGVIVGPPSLLVLTTSDRPSERGFAEAHGTSPAAAEVARICAHVRARYPDYWPETVRALVVHGAAHTEQMRQELPKQPGRSTDLKDFIRRYGYGRVSLLNSVSSALRGPTMVLQESITPFVKRDGSVQMNEMQLFDLPWPTDELARLDATEVRMKITLSYFVEPNPSRRGWQSKFRYQSHGLRFAVRGAAETQKHFIQRINKLERELALATDDIESELSDPDNKQWSLGAKLRARGSLHCDEWIGTAQQLREKSAIAVYPVGGWWKDWSDSQRAGVAVRYALVVSLVAAEDVPADLYTPIQTEIQTKIAVLVPGI